MSAAYLQCIDDDCRQEYPLGHREHLCERCGNLLDVRYEFEWSHSGAPLDRCALRDTWERRKSEQRGDRSEWRLALSRAFAFRARRGADRESFGGPHPAGGGCAHGRVGGRRAPRHQASRQ